MKVAVLASGSSGNSVWVASETTSLMVDAGISRTRAKESAEALRLDAGGVRAILVTHEHSDHVSGLSAVARHYQAPVYATAGTHGAIAGRGLNRITRRVIEAGAEFDVGDLRVSPFSISHDSVDPVGYSITDGVHRVVVATDMGVVSHSVRRRIAEAHCLVLEFNHDERMLLDGGYPWFLKQRILGREGHLSNEAAARELTMLADCPLSTVVLAHLSRENNTRELALETASLALRRAGREDVSIIVSDQRSAVGPVVIGEALEPAALAIRGTDSRCTG